MVSTLDCAHRWLDFGVSPIPLAPRSKLPMLKWSRWSEQLPSIDLVDQWFSPKYKRNIGLCCGMNNLTVIDFDNMQYYNEWYSSIKKIWQRILSSTYSVKTARGVHFYLRTRELERTRKLKVGVDVKAERSFVVASPSVHPSGVVYTDNARRVLTVDNTTDLFPYPVFEPAPTVIEPLSEWYMQDDGSAPTIDIKTIKKSVTILDVVSGYTRMFRTSANGRWWMGRCPAITHKDTHPSFRVDTKNNRCTCLSCGCILYGERGLDIFDFYQRMNNVDLRTALADLSQLCHSSF